MLQESVRWWPLAWLLLLLLLAQPSSSASRAAGGIKALQKMLNQQPTTGHGLCNFDRGCEWAWKNDTFRQVTARELTDPLAPTADANNNENGKFLWISGNTTAQLRSKIIPVTGPTCYLELYLYQIEMAHGKISVVIKNMNTTMIGKELTGNNSARWNVTKFNVNSKSQDFMIILEIKLPYENSSIGIDNIRLVDCFPERRIFPVEECNPMMFRCKDQSCLRRDHFCDLVPDCLEGEDEAGVCLDVPKEARCNFERNWCGWRNVNNLLWKLGNDTTNLKIRVTKPINRNTTGSYAYVDMSNGGQMGNEAVLQSPVFNPMPPYHKGPPSSWVNSCKVRFFYYQVNLQTAALGLWQVKMTAHQLRRERLFWSFKDVSNMWQSVAVVLPYSKTKYYLQFEAVKSYGSNGFVAIQDISLSPECFGINVPADVLGDYNYYNQKIETPAAHPDFLNETSIVISTCNQTGRIGPTPEQCAKVYNNDTDIEVLSESSIDRGDAMLRSKGIQRWIVPSGGFYTIIAKGARGGMGALATGISMGAIVQGVVELEKGQALYFMIGQPGTDACVKRLGATNYKCQKSKSNYTLGSNSPVHAIKNTEPTDGGGGGGGATYVFTLKKNGEQQPLLIAGGGGGLGSTQFHDDQQDAKGVLQSGRKAVNGTSYTKDAGGGGGLFSGSSNETSAYGMALTKGGIGGIGCGPSKQGYGDGGFGGGGGGCLSGGGGGGYAGGDTGHVPSGNGEGGYSYASPDLSHVSFTEKEYAGPGEVHIISAISNGCGCDYRCTAVNEYLSETQCICPSDWHLNTDNKSCLKNKHDHDRMHTMHRTFFIILIVVSIFLIFALSGLFFLLYNRYTTRKMLQKRRQVMFTNGTELAPLRNMTNNMISEFNPNYEFAGNLYSFKDLTQIPRSNITLVKALGQGAFGEVYQGVYRTSTDEEYPVAVKTLLPMSTSQAEADFMMEALIMSKFDHPNIVHFVGVSFEEHPRYIVLELLAGGDLKNFLREERPRPDLPTSLSMENLLLCAHDVAKGCQYMEAARFIHRDIAARNCLLTCKGPGRVVKVADFGMARDIYRSEYYKKGGKAMLPVKWMPPESFMDGIFSTKTDVWSFGVLLWEIMSFGYMPYTGCTNREVMQMVANGGRLERPAGCPDPVYGIMTQCWHPSPENRPSFQTIVERIGYCLQDPDVINHPTPSFDNMPMYDPEITIMRPDPETECINMHTELDGHGYMQPRVFYRPKSSQNEQQPGIVYAALKHAEDRENCNDLKSSPDSDNYNMDPEKQNLNDVCDNRQPNPNSEPNANVIEPLDAEDIKDDDGTGESKSRPDGQNGNGESTTTTDTNSDSLFMTSSGMPPDTASSTPNTRTSSPNRSVAAAVAAAAAANNGNGSLGNVNGIIRKSALKAALSLDPSALCNPGIPYEKIGFAQPKPKLAGNPGNMELPKHYDEQDSLSHELPREECSC